MAPADTVGCLLFTDIQQSLSILCASWDFSECDVELRYPSGRTELGLHCVLTLSAVLW